MQFAYQPLTWAFLLVLAPLVIHLITRMRHRPVAWAAMEFLLASHKKHRRWIWLKQLLLLLARMAVVAAVVAMLARLITMRQWSGLFGGQTTHHFVVLDDSLSTADRTGGAAAFDRARQALVQISRQAVQDEGSQKMTLVRCSRAARAPRPDQATAATQADLNAVPLNVEFPEQLAQISAGFSATELAVGPKAALQLVESLVEQVDEERCVLHLISDFRQTDWAKPAELREILARLSRRGTQLHLVRCAAQQRPNLAITQLLPAAGTRAAGVPLFLQVQVKNFASAPAQQVLLKVRSTFHPASLDGSESTPQTADLPDVQIDRIEPDETVSRQVQVFFPTAGQHVVQARLPADAILADNQRSCVVDLPLGEPVTLVDGDPAGQAAYYLESIFQPSGATKTGILPQSQPLSYLRDVTPEALAGQRAVYLLNVPQLEPLAVEHLEAYVRGGGGLAIFLGPESNVAFYNNWYADGNGLFPVPLSAPADLPEAGGETPEPDLRFADHPVFRVLAGQRNPFAGSIRVQRYLAVPELWQPPRDSTIEVLARLRNRQPLIVERRYGEGRVVAFLTTATPTWNNWALEPSFIVVALQLHAYLAQQQQTDQQRFVGSPLALQLDGTQYRPEVTFLAPLPNRDAPSPIERTAQPTANQDATLLTTSLGVDPPTGMATGETDVSGMYEALLRTLEGTLRHRRFALNVDPVESDLALPAPAELVERLAPLQVRVDDAEQLLFQTGSNTGHSWSELLLGLAILLLLAEQWLAFLASYHPKSAIRAGGVR